jgi:hypothetical protein
MTSSTSSQLDKEKKNSKHPANELNKTNTDLALQTILRDTTFHGNTLLTKELNRAKEYNVAEAPCRATCGVQIPANCSPGGSSRWR